MPVPKAENPFVRYPAELAGLNQNALDKMGADLRVLVSTNADQVVVDRDRRYGSSHTEDGAEQNSITQIESASDPEKGQTGSMIPSRHRDQGCDRNDEEAGSTIKCGEAASGEERVGQKHDQQREKTDIGPSIAQPFSGKHHAPPKRQEVRISHRPSVGRASILRSVHKALDVSEQRDRPAVYQGQEQIGEEERRADHSCG